VLLLAFSGGILAADRADSFDAIVQQRVADSELPACVAAAMVDGTTRFAFGCSPGAGPAVPKADSIFEIGSISKVFVGLILADMVRKGEVALDDPASKYSRPGAKLPTRNGKDILLLHLVTHTSGLPRMPPKFAGAPADPYAAFGPDALYESLASTELTRDIGVHYEYSNFGFMWLSEIVSRVDGKPFAQLVRERILAPLGMKDTSVALDDERRKRLVPGHNVRYEPVREWEFAPEIAGVGGLRSTIADMARFAEAIAGARSTPLDATIALATQPLFKGPGNLSLAYAWHVREVADGKRLHLHNGGTGGYRSMMAVDRAAKRASVVLVDSSALFDDLPPHLLEPTQPLARKRVAMPLEPAKLREYAGVYQVSPAFSIRVFVDGERLMAQGSNQPSFPIFAESPDHFFARIVNAEVVFRRGADGKVEGLTLIQGGREVAAPRAAEKP
jgi:serine-type D-Ala-D-Ala carboxypeptidase/endopeptidase